MDIRRRIKAKTPQAWANSGAAMGDKPAIKARQRD
jgi:hypothetical protein